MPHTPEPRWNARRKRWYVKLRGKQHILAYGRENKHKAWEKFNRIRGEVYAIDPPGEPVTVRQLIAQFLRLYPSDKNEHLLDDWKFLEADKPISKLGRDCLVVYAQHLKSLDNGAWSLRGKIGAASRVIRWWSQMCDDFNLLPIRPVLPKPPKGHRDIPRQKLTVMLKKMDEPRRHRTACIFKFILATGCRPGEARKLKWSHIDLDDREARLAPDEHKTGHDTGDVRIIDLNDDALKCLNEAAGRDGLRGVVFRNNLGRPFPRGGVHQNVSRWLDITPNQLRHTFAQNAIDQVGVLDVSVLLGHKTTRMTEVYVSIRRQRAKKVAQNIASPLKRTKTSEYPALDHLQSLGKKPHGESASA